MPGIGYLSYLEDKTFKGPIDKFLSEDDRKNLTSGINFKYKQIDWLHEIKEKIERLS